MISKEMVNPQEFEEPELYESMKNIKKVDSKKQSKKKASVCELKKTTTKPRKKNSIRKKKVKVRRPFLDLEKMLKV